MLAGADLGGDDLAGPFHQWMVLARIIFPAAIEEVEPVQDLAAELDRIDRAALIPVARGELGMAADAARETGGEAVVLLSPACASFDQFRNFEVRGEAFKQAVSAIEGIEPIGGSR